MLYKQINQAHQVALGFDMPQSVTLDNFCLPNQNLLKQKISQMLAGESPRFIHIWGEAGVGKTHILQAACHSASVTDVPSMFLPMRNLVNLSTDILLGLDTIPVLCIDDIDTRQNTLWNRSLQRLITQKLLGRGGLVISSTAPNLLGLLNFSEEPWVYKLEPMDQNSKINALQLQAQTRGVQLNLSAAKLILKHCNFDLKQGYVLLENLDKQAFLQKCPINVAFINKYVSDL